MAIKEKPQSVKRRKIRHVSTQQTNESGEIPTSSPPDGALPDNPEDSQSEGDFTSPELPPFPRSNDDVSDDSDEAPKKNPRVHIPTRVVDQENTFVTQLTQPPSSPSRIRGPRWKKRTSTDAESVSDSGSDSISSRRQQILPAEPGGTKFQAHVSNGHDSRSAAADFSAILQDNPDFFSDDLDEAQDDVVFLSSARKQTSGTAVRGPPQALRQMTLDGQSTPSAASTTKQKAHNWPLASKVEQPTHHKLDDEALKTWVYPTNLGSIRDYQFNITKCGLFQNLLVALPTGLGKTFIAATIMFNWYRWTKDAHIVFVAPTKPLVAQQVDACFKVVGIPRSDTSMLTGNIAPALRAEEWLKKRVFFMTPQTLHHDLTSGICDPKKIVLLVVDEAHRATGNYAYVEVVRFLRRFNNSFRVLALTATPGASVEAVQNVVDGLDIARVEIRTEESLDIRQYVHRRNIELEIFDFSDEVTMIMDLFSKTLQPHVTKLKSQNAYWGKDPMSLTAFGLTKNRQQWMGSEAGRRAPHGLKGMVNTLFTLLASLAHAIDLLKFHGIGPFYRNLVNFRNETIENNKGGKYAKEICNNEHFKKMMNRMQAWINNEDFVGHPKLSYLKTVVLNHFLDAGAGQGAAGGRPPSDTRIMIFVHFRDSAEDVTRVLKKHEPMIRPHVFVGQAGAKGSDGMDQKTQLDIIQKFKSGVYNTIVATSIGEEGLDIGEIDLIVCYDSSSSPIRMLQRMGRTGRKRAGKIQLLLMRGKEEESYMKAKDNYEKMQAMIADGSRFQFHDDRSPRIVPKGVQPVVDKRVIDIPIENTQSELPEPKKRGRKPKMPAKKFFMPEGVQTGFVKASRLNGDEEQSDGDTVAEQIRQAEQKRQAELLKPAPLPRLDQVLLTGPQEAELESHYCNISGTSPQYVHVPDLGAFPFLQKAVKKVDLVPHSRSAVSLTRALSTRSPLGEKVWSKKSIAPAQPMKNNKPIALEESDNEEDSAVSITSQQLIQASADASSRSSTPGSDVVSKGSGLFVTQDSVEASDDSAEDELPNPSQLLKLPQQDKPHARKSSPVKIQQAQPARRKRRMVFLDDSDDE